MRVNPVDICRREVRTGVEVAAVDGVGREPGVQRDQRGGVVRADRSYREPSAVPQPDLVDDHGGK
jgi:hypothetical protein